jgi:hypothetical protein
MPQREPTLSIPAAAEEVRPCIERRGRRRQGVSRNTSTASRRMGTGYYSVVPRAIPLELLRGN